jgi:2-dehydropantoate 2-reductase
MAAAQEFPSEANITVYGAGSIGCFIGGLLRAEGRQVTFIGRPRIAAELGAAGLHLTDFAGLDVRLTPQMLTVKTASEALVDANLVLLTVKIGDTAQAAEDLAGRLVPGTPIVSLQNGVDGLAVLRNRLGEGRVLGGIVGFNVLHKGSGHFHRGTSGTVTVEAGRPDALNLLTVPSLDVKASTDIIGAQWGKLILNLNNALNALSGLPLKRQLENRAWRQILANQIAEAVAILDAAGIAAAAPSKVPLRFVPAILRLPSALFRLAAPSMLQIDPEARSSMWEDLTLRRRTEVDYFQGAIIRLARSKGMEAPLSQRILELVKRAETAAAGSPGLLPNEVGIS